MEAAAELKQLVLAPNLAYKINEQHSIGVSLLLVHQSIEAAGLEGFTSYSVDATHLTGKGPDTSMGYGLKLGWIGLLSDNFRLGATYQMKTDMSVFENYKGLLAEGGNADIPAVFALGGAYKMENSEFLFEIKQIMNSGVASLSNPNTISSAATFLGTNQGAGFGFKDQTVFKLGYILKREQEHRFGINYGKSVVEKENVGFAFLAPAVGELHLSYGSSLAMGEGSKLNYTLWYLMPNTVEGDTQVGVTPSKGKVSLNQVALAVAYTWDLN